MAKRDFDGRVGLIGPEDERMAGQLRQCIVRIQVVACAGIMPIAARRAITVNDFADFAVLGGEPSDLVTLIRQALERDKTAGAPLTAGRSPLLVRIDFTILFVKPHAPRQARFARGLARFGRRFMRQNQPIERRKRPLPRLLGLEGVGERPGRARRRQIEIIGQFRRKRIRIEAPERGNGLTRQPVVAGRPRRERLALEMLVHAGGGFHAEPAQHNRCDQHVDRFGFHRLGGHFGKIFFLQSPPVEFREIVVQQLREITVRSGILPVYGHR